MTGRLISTAMVLIVPVSLAQAQADMAPTNNLPNPFQTIEGWAKLPEGRVWGSTSAVYPDKDGVSIWVAERCGANSCAGSTLNSVFKFDSTGRLLQSFGAGLINSPHGLFVDHEGNVWVTDCSCTGGGGGRGRGAGAAAATGSDTSARGRAAGAGAAAGGAAAAAAAPGGVAAAGPPKGHQIFKFSPDGRVLMTLGRAGGVNPADTLNRAAGANAPGYFWQPNGMLVAPNGDIFVVEGHGQGGDRVLKFSKDGTLIKTWGKRGTARSEFNQPHAIAMDSRGRLFVGDRGNNRIQIFDQDGNYLDEWYQFSRPSGIFIDPQDNIYVADSESGSVNPAHVAWQRGIRIGKATDGSITAFIPDPNTAATNTSAAEGVAVDSRGVIYGAEVGPRAIKKYVRR
jgi:hypothetical protein